ncbi:39S ribosomal protein L38, mitochondrial [Aplysia californica]|uniref:Large ribosomal subunit protein mL38 n=1 Tax=Aplysia californica TaxID=6500 RepID=A0ABM0JZX0_APLCA|nr:39S ribosomal protein L38, mitochondrial [Aplysia californica]
MAACGRSVGCRLQCLIERSNQLKSVCVQSVRYRWKPPDRDLEVLPSFSERLSEFKANHEVPPASTGINVGFPFTSSTNRKTSLQKLQQWTKTKAGKEKAARHRQLKIDLEEVHREWSVESRPRHVCKVAQHYGLYQDMFDGAHFYPVVPLDVWFDYDEEFVTPVRYGNVIPAREAEVQPCAEFEAEEDSLWTLVMSSPDGNLEQNDRELLHWMVGNIPGGDVEKGETLCKYLQPFPVKGAGFLRYVFVLYKQQRPLDLDSLRRSSDGYSLRERSFSTLDFYRKFEDSLTPAGLAFFQSQWDSSVRSTFHNILDMPEPKFEFIHPPAYVPEQLEVPHRRAFNMYLDRYRDVKDLQEEVLRYKLKDKDPTKPPPPQPKFNNIDLLPSTTSSWLRGKVQHMRIGKFHWKSVYEEPKE